MTALNEKNSFVHTGPNDVAGKYLRLFWQPVFDGTRLAKGQAVPIRIMGASYTLYRGESGTAHVVDFRCPHRGTQLSTGWVENDDIRCFFHGWKFSSAGQCLEQPAEAKEFCHKVKIGAYPTQEQMGLIFSYFGPLPAPPLPRWPEFETPNIVSSIEMIPCNYFQSAENIVDDIHVGFAHYGATSMAGAPIKKLECPTVDAAETGYGIKMTYTAGTRVEETHFLMPNSHYVSYFLGYVAPPQKLQDYRTQTLFWYVPIDDVSHYHVMVTRGHPDVIHMMRAEKQAPHDVAADIHDVLRNGAAHHKHGGRAMRRPDLIRIQDGITIAGQGEIADRSSDRLGTSDAGVILLRRVWTRELRKMEIGESLKRFERPASLPL